MIFYEAGKWQLHLICRCHGSVFPRAMVWGLPSGIAAVVVHHFFYDSDNVASQLSQAWGAVNFLLVFLVVFRTQQAYARFWEGVTLLEQLKGNWLMALSSTFAFCSTDPKKEDEVDSFQHLLARLMSLLHCSALQDVAMMDDEAFEVIDLVGIDMDKMEYLASRPENKCLILLQWVQRLIIQAMQQEILTPPAPIITRIFQQLGHGYTNMVDAQKITDIPLPFPYTQMVTLLLTLGSIGTPVVNGMTIDSKAWAGCITTLCVAGYWSINFIAAEIEMPYGDDPNDIPIAELQSEMNRDLKIILCREAQHPPGFAFHRATHELLNDIPCSQELMTSLSENNNNALTGMAALEKGRTAQKFSRLEAARKSHIAVRQRVTYPAMASNNSARQEALNSSTLSLFEDMPRESTANSRSAGTSKESTERSESAKAGVKSRDVGIEVSELQRDWTPRRLPVLSPGKAVPRECVGDLSPPGGAEGLLGVGDLPLGVDRIGINIVVQAESTTGCDIDSGAGRALSSLMDHACYLRKELENDEASMRSDTEPVRL